MTTAAQKKAAEKKALAAEKKAANRNHDEAQGLSQASTTSEPPPGDQVNTVAQPPVEDPDRAPVEGEDNIGFKMKGGRNSEANDEEAPADKKWGIASRARWGSSDSNSTLQHQESREIEANLADQE